MQDISLAVFVQGYFDYVARVSGCTVGCWGLLGGGRQWGSGKGGVLDWVGGWSVGESVGG